VELLIATRNPGKVREIQQALSSLPIKLRYLEEFGNVSSVAEVGRTYEENAVMKALGYAKQTGVSALADDSGLEVDALGGIPGVLSARFAGDHASDHQRIEKLLTTLSQQRDHRRSARFICCMALVGWEPTEVRRRLTEPHVLSLAEAKCEGVIANAAHGVNGFGFDPVFVPSGYEETFAELPLDVKRKISHRALALAMIREFLEGWLSRT
jgi:XTP/dITP diphosphohydrolase